jgi:hypothetical protein
VMSTNDMWGENVNSIFLVEAGSRSTSLLGMKVQVLLVNASCRKLMLYLMSLLATGGNNCDRMVGI